jgi:hypothetical protein
MARNLHHDNDWAGTFPSVNRSTAMNKIEHRFTAFMEAVGGFICRLGDWVSITCRRKRS